MQSAVGQGRVLSVAAIWLLASSCGSLSGPVFQGPVGPVFQQLVAVPAEQGSVYVYRPSSFVGGGAAIRVSIDGNDMGYLPNAAYIATTLPPGLHVVRLLPYEDSWMATPDAAALDVSVTAGSDTYVRTVWSLNNVIGYSAGTITFQTVDKNLGLAEIKTLKRSK